MATENIAVTRLYENRALEDLIRNFSELLGKKPKEELLQQFIETNPILLQPFSPQRIFFKPPILSKYKADFAILTHKKTLLLVEIEKSTTKLVTKSGGVSAELQHACDQVHSWLHEVRTHRHAILDGLKIEEDEVGQIRGVVVAGRDQNHSDEHLLRLRARDFGELEVLTYDDLLRSARELVNQVLKI